MNTWFKRGSVVAVSIMLAGLIASCGSSAPTQDLSATASALSATQQALEQLQQEPTATTESAQPEQSEQQADETATDNGPYYLEEFSEPPQDWTYYLYSGDERDFDLFTDHDRLVFDIKGTNIWAYYVYDSYSYDDVRVDFRAENLGNNNNNVSLICRLSDRGWYEFNVSNSGLYNIYRYTTSDSNFYELYSGGVANMRVGKDTNEFTMICDGDRLTLGVNGTEIRTVEDSYFDEGQVGVGVSSFDLTPVLVEMDYVEISQP